MTAASKVGKLLPEPILKALRPLYYGAKSFKNTITGIADAYGIIDPENIYGEEYYKKRQGDPWRSESREISKELYNRFKPESVIDFGCAIGHYLEVFYEHEVDIQGVEGNENAFPHAVIPRSKIDQHDLRKPYEVNRSYDLGLCLEVAEHIPQRHEDKLVQTVASACDVLIFTAAPPGQRGTHHINLQPREYWISKFENRGMEFQQDETERLKEALELNHLQHMEDNFFVFSSNK